MLIDIYLIKLIFFMELIDVFSYSQMKEMLEDSEKAFVMLYKSGSESSDCALSRLESIGEIPENVLLLKADVSQVRDIHPVYNITSVPTLLQFDKGELKNVIKGCMTEDYYESLVKGIYSKHSGDENEQKPQKRVIVYSTPSCPWCTRLKNYLKEKNIKFEDVDVAANRSRAEEMQRKSGQMGVPQTDIQGQIIVGFDKPKINRLLGIN